MKYIKTYYIIFSLLFLSSLRTYCQDETDKQKEHVFQHHRITLFTGYGLITRAMNEEGKKQIRVIPIVGLDYEYWFNHKIGLGLLNDLELSSYVVEKDQQEHIAREYAIVSALVFLYEPLKGWALFAGPGYEFEKNHSFYLFKIGTELSKNFQNGWSAGIGLAYDIKEVNSSASVGVTVSKKFGKY